MKKRKNINLKGSYVLFDKEDDEFAVVVKPKKKITDDCVSILVPFQISPYFQDVLTKSKYSNNRAFKFELFNKSSFYVEPTTMYIDEEIAQKIQQNNVEGSDVVKIIERAKNCRRNKPAQNN